MGGLFPHVILYLFYDVFQHSSKSDLRHVECYVCARDSRDPGARAGGGGRHGLYIVADANNL